MKQAMANESKYKEGYDTLTRFISYHTQISLIKELDGVNKILEIGVGNKTLTNYLKGYDYGIVTLDKEKGLTPDMVGDIRKIPIKAGSFDLVVAFQVLEHIPFGDVSKAINQMWSVTKKYAVISVPHPSAAFEIIVKIPFLGFLIGKSFIRLFFEIPYRPFTFTLTKEHYWELGTKGYSLNRFRMMLRKNFKIIKEVRPLLNSYHHFFVLEKL